MELQDEVNSNRLGVRRVKSEDNLADIGTKALSNKTSETMRHPRGTLLLKGLWVDISEQAGQSSPDQQKTSLESTGGHARQQQQR